jgi:protein-S-isoprenylcysteine O-methyltransferase Ste14
MPNTLRKLIGTVMIIVLVLVYAFLAVLVASATLGKAHWSVHLAYFFVTGLLWVLPAMWIIKWMHRPDRPKQTIK